MQQFGVFGYGSLISSDSRARTAGSTQPRPWMIEGFSRCFSVLDRDAKMASAAITPAAAGKCNGVLFGVSAEQLLAFDQRELPWGYRRLELALQNTGHQADYAYVLDAPQRPTETAPMVQSYIDVILDGCLQISEQFAIEFIQSTNAWGDPWINDRRRPRYLRPLTPSKQRIEQIDALLIAHLGLSRVAQRDAAI